MNIDGSVSTQLMASPTYIQETRHYRQGHIVYQRKGF